MAKGVRGNFRLASKEARKKLKVRDKPWFCEVRKGLSLGYRKGISGGSWTLREFKDGKYLPQRHLGIADDTVQADGSTVLSWDDAVKIALAQDRPTITRPAKYTVAQAADYYFSTKPDLSECNRITYDAFIAAERDGIPDLADKAVSELTTEDLKRWQKAQVPAALWSAESDDDKESLRQAKVTANRRLHVLKAILNLSFNDKPQTVLSDTEWRRVKPYGKQNGGEVDQARERTMDAAEAKKVLSKLAKPLKDLAKGSLLTGCRQGELLRLTVADVGETSLRIRKITTKGKKVRHQPLNTAGAEFFKSMCAGKAETDFVFERLYRVGISREMIEASALAKLKSPVVFHDFRRSYGSMLINAGESADVIQDLLGHADVRTTRRTYAHIIKKTLETAVKSLPNIG